ncbi:hypothetical protein [Marinobacterium aestuariivivens]|uniref:Uncharacterized protein n=1 Tax=Marinobacterium aestuariivivens TaxID=1698799 RepID=A0ABW2A6Q1_9GAMM
MNIIRTGSLAGCLLSVFVSCSTLAAPGQGGAAAFSGDPDRLPPGRLKSQIEKLPPAAQQRALEWLERFDIPVEDYEFLHVDGDGAIFYADTVLPDEADGTTEPSEPGVEAIAPEDAFLLHSRPGASQVVFLDFDGHVITDTAWNSGGASSYFARPYDTDGNPTGFSDSERNQIAEIWHRVAEDMAPFDIDVTTEDPGGFGPTTGHVLITDSTDETGSPMPHSSAGGVAYVGVWGLRTIPTISRRWSITTTSAAVSRPMSRKPRATSSGITWGSVTMAPRRRVITAAMAPVTSPGPR